MKSCFLRLLDCYCAQAIHAHADVLVKKLKVIILREDTRAVNELVHCGVNFEKIPISALGLINFLELNKLEISPRRISILNYLMKIGLKAIDTELSNELALAYQRRNASFILPDELGKHVRVAVFCKRMIQAMVKLLTNFVESIHAGYFYLLKVSYCLRKCCVLQSVPR